LLHAAVQKVLNSHPDASWVADITLVDVCVQTLSFCAKVDDVAGSFEKIVRIYAKLMHDTVNGELNKDLAANNDEGESVDYLLTSPPATSSETNSTLQRAVRDLITLVRRPFAQSELELVPADSDFGDFSPQVRATLVNWMEAAMGAAQEWRWELRNCGLQSDEADEAGEFADASSIAVVMSQLTPGQFAEGGESSSSWQAWSPNTY
jgi:hypothetical protein